eukprot:1746497-Pyramimonas_sp.AAC.1
MRGEDQRHFILAKLFHEQLLDIQSGLSVSQLQVDSILSILVDESHFTMVLRNGPRRRGRPTVARDCAKTARGGGRMGRGGGSYAPPRIHGPTVLGRPVPQFKSTEGDRPT